MILVSTVMENMRKICCYSHINSIERLIGFGVSGAQIDTWAKVTLQGDFTPIHPVQH